MKKIHFVVSYLNWRLPDPLYGVLTNVFDCDCCYICHRRYTGPLFCEVYFHPLFSKSSHFKVDWWPSVVQWLAHWNYEPVVPGSDDSGSKHDNMYDLWFWKGHKSSMTHPFQNGFYSPNWHLLAILLVVYNASFVVSYLGIIVITFIQH